MLIYDKIKICVQNIEMKDLLKCMYIFKLTYTYEQMVPVILI